MPPSRPWKTNRASAQKKVGEGHSPTVNELLGIAQGCIGMSREDFACSTPDEFQAVYDAWFHHEESEMQRSWEVGRFVAAALLQPYSKKAMKPADLIVFPWEKTERHSAGVKGTSNEERAKVVLAKLEKSGLLLTSDVQKRAQFKQENEKQDKS